MSRTNENYWWNEDLICKAHIAIIKLKEILTLLKMRKAEECNPVLCGNNPGMLRAEVYQICKLCNWNIFKPLLVRMLSVILSIYISKINMAQKEKSLKLSCFLTLAQETCHPMSQLLGWNLWLTIHLPQKFMLKKDPVKHSWSI